LLLFVSRQKEDEETTEFTMKPQDKLTERAKF